MADDQYSELDEALYAIEHVAKKLGQVDPPELDEADIGQLDFALNKIKNVRNEIARHEGVSQEPLPDLSDVQDVTIELDDEAMKRLIDKNDLDEEDLIAHIEDAR